MFNIIASAGAFVIAAPFVLIITLFGVMWRSWWFYPAWGWFIVPLGVVPIRFWHFAALLMIV